MSSLITPSLKEDQRESTISLLGLKNLTTQKTTQINRPVNNISPIIITPIKPIPRTPKIPDLILPGEKAKPKPSEAYNVLIKRDSTKFAKARWEQVNRKPLTQNSALSMGARETDESISARFKIQQIQDKVEKIRNFAGQVIGKRKVETKPVDTKDNYFKINQNKFRPYRIKKGKKISNEPIYIERSGYRNDSQREKETLRSAKEKSINIRSLFGI